MVNVFRALCILGGDAAEARKAEEDLAKWKEQKVRMHARVRPAVCSRAEPPLFASVCLSVYVAVCE